jgi:hypothetical protein
LILPFLQTLSALVNLVRGRRSQAYATHHLCRSKGFFNFDQSLIERIACEDEVDREIIRYLFEAGSHGLLPKDLTMKLERFKIRRHQVSRRILRMNNRLEKEFGEPIAEQRGWHWALTSFVIESWRNTRMNPVE